MKAYILIYILKDNIARLVPAIQREVKESQERERRRKAESALFSSEAKFKALWDSSVIGMVIANLGIEILETNDAFLHMLGYTRRDFEAGLLSRERLTPMKWRYLDIQAIKEFKEAGSCSPYEKQFLDKSGKLIDVQVVFTPLNIHRRDMVIACIVDITERRKKEEAEMASLRKNQLLSNMSHELRSPLHNIATACNMGLEGFLGTLTDKQSKIFSLVRSNADHLLEIINEILDISSIEAGKDILHAQYFEPVQLIQETLQLTKPLIEQKQQRLTVDILDNLPSLFYGDFLRLKQALGNLLSNAHKYTPSGKQIRLRAFINDIDELVMSVQDEGPGVPITSMEAIFRPFERDNLVAQKIPGTGLGLPISKKIVELHHGRLEIETQLNQGSTFSILLPMISTIKLSAQSSLGEPRQSSCIR